MPAAYLCVCGKRAEKNKKRCTACAAAEKARVAAKSPDRRSHGAYQRSASQGLEERLCHLCGDRPLFPGEKWHVDHVVPRSKGGLDVPSNYAWAHGKCNEWRASKNLDETLKKEIRRRRMRDWRLLS